RSWPKRSAGGCFVTRPPTSCETRPRTWSQGSPITGKNRRGTTRPGYVRRARDHLCRVEPTEPTPDWFHHHPPPRVGDVGSRATPAHGPLAALPNHSGQRKAPPGPVCRGIGGTRWLRRRRAATDRDGAGARIPELLLDQRPSASADGPRNDPDLREPESRREPLR